MCITGQIPDVDPGKDETDLAIRLVKRITKVELKRTRIRNCHFMGDNCLLLEFITAGTMSPIGAILNPIHRQKMRAENVWLNIHMTKDDRHVLYQARAMRRAGIVSKAFPNLQAITVVVQDGRKYLARRSEDLQALTSTPLQDIIKADHSQNDSGYTDS